jgi:hypothetical protein
MGRSRESSAARARRRGGPVLRRYALAGLCALAACETLFTDLDAVIALQVFVPDSGAVEMGDTVQPRARALNGHGDSVAATIFWAALDTAFVTVLDSTTGATLGRDTLGEGRIQARVGSLRSNPLPIRVQSPADSIRPTGPLRNTVDLAAADSVSDSLTVRVFTTPDNNTNRIGRRVTLTTEIYPTTGATVTLQPGDTILTGSGGTAFVRVRLTSGQPDSVRVTATARRADGQAVPGSATFVVEFRP